MDWEKRKVMEKKNISICGEDEEGNLYCCISPERYGLIKFYDVNKNWKENIFTSSALFSIVGCCIFWFTGFWIFWSWILMGLCKTIPILNDKFSPFICKNDISFAVQIFYAIIQTLMLFLCFIVIVIVILFIISLFTCCILCLYFTFGRIKSWLK